MSTNVAPLPFPLKDGLVDATAGNEDTAEEEEKEEEEEEAAVAEGEYHQLYDDLELTRAPRSSEVRL